jgi:Arc/MetJ family transcription regulator
MKTNIVLNDELVAEAFALTGVQTEKELIDLALRELVRVRRKKDLSELAGRVSLRDDFDHKALRATRNDFG